MATIQFYLRVKTAPDVATTINFRYRKINLILATPYKIQPKNWDGENQVFFTEDIMCNDGTIRKSEYVKGARLKEVKENNERIEDFNRDLTSFKNKVEGFIGDLKDKNEEEQRKLIKEYVHKNYFAHRIKKGQANKNSIPNGFSSLIDFYIEKRSIEDKTEGGRNRKPLAINTIKKYRTLQSILNKYNKNLKATDINNMWRLDFVDYLNKQKYSENTQVKYIKDIKMLCLFANDEHNINKQVLGWKINANPTNVSEYLTFSFSQLEDLRTAIMPSERLNNARDWLLISCYTSVRVSELLTMKVEDIEQHGEDYFITVYEKKNGKPKVIFLLPQVVEILNKRNGQFPKKISDQRYNDYIKEVCEQAKMTDEITHGIMEGKRKVIKKLPFFNFVTSHSGRATFVTLFKDRLPSEILQMQTNHQSTEMLERYDKTEEKLQLLKRGKAFAQAYKESGDYKHVKLEMFNILN